MLEVTSGSDSNQNISNLWLPS